MTEFHNKIYFMLYNTNWNIKIFPVIVYYFLTLFLNFISQYFHLTILNKISVSAILIKCLWTEFNFTCRIRLSKRRSKTILKEIKQIRYDSGLKTTEFYYSIEYSTIGQSYNLEFRLNNNLECLKILLYMEKERNSVNWLTVINFLND